jgi:hypothetical protein
MSEHFPHVRLLGYEQQRNMKQSRAVLMFGRTQQALEQALRLVELKTERYFRNEFFDAHARTTGRDLVQYARRLSESADARVKFSGIGKPYFELFLAGYFEYVRDGRVSPDNIFARSFRHAIEEGRMDPSLRYLLESEPLLIEKVEKRFVDIALAARGEWHLTPPIIVVPDEAGPHCFTQTSGRKIKARNIDGHHRYFIAQLLSRPTIDALVGEPTAVKREILKKMA